MALIIKDRVLETSTTTGTGDVTLSGAVVGYRTFASVCSTNDTTYYLIEAVDGSGIPTGDWETGLGTYSASNTLTRTTVKASSNSGSLVSFSAGTKRVSISAVAASMYVKPNIPKASDFGTLRNGTSITAATITDVSYGVGVQLKFHRFSGASNWPQSYILQGTGGGNFRAEALISAPYQSSNNWFQTSLSVSGTNASDVAKHLSVGIYMDGTGAWQFFPRAIRNNGLNAQESGFTTSVFGNVATTQEKFWLAIEYDGTNINAYGSFDGYSWVKGASEPATFFTGTPNLVGFGWEAVAADGGFHFAYCPHFKLTTNLSDPFGLNT
jgi:hypothetical protein